jgi:hypothetical protein
VCVRIMGGCDACVTGQRVVEVSCGFRVPAAHPSNPSPAIASVWRRANQTLGEHLSRSPTHHASRPSLITCLLTTATRATYECDHAPTTRDYHRGSLPPLQSCGIDAALFVGAGSGWLAVTVRGVPACTHLSPPPLAPGKSSSCRHSIICF